MLELSRTDNSYVVETQKKICQEDHSFIITCDREISNQHQLYE